MVIIQVLDETCHYAVGVIDVRLALTLEVFFIQKLQEFLLEDVF